MIEPYLKRKTSFVQLYKMKILTYPLQHLSLPVLAGFYCLCNLKNSLRSTPFRKEIRPTLKMERYKFITHGRCTYDKSVANFFAELRRSAKYCKFGFTLDLDEVLGDRFIFGIQNEVIQQKLLASNKVTLTRATEIAMEMAPSNASNFRNLLTGKVNKRNSRRKEIMESV